MIGRSGRVDRRRKRVEERRKKSEKDHLETGGGESKGLNMSNELTTRDFWGESGLGEWVR